MNRRQIRKLQRNAKMAVVCGSMLYLATGVTVNGKEENIEKIYVSEYVSNVPEVLNQESINKAVEETPVLEETIEISVESYGLDYGDAYLLAKIAMAEAEGEDTEGKALVMRVVLNRTYADGFPDNIEEVIFQKTGDTWQFSPMQDGGRWYTTEPDADCWDALELIEHGWDESQGALYFESVGQSEWHKNNLEFLFKHGKHYFYREKESAY